MAHSEPITLCLIYFLAFVTIKHIKFADSTLQITFMEILEPRPPPTNIDENYKPDLQFPRK